jgi:hypothetical protein
MSEKLGVINITIEIADKPWCRADHCLIIEVTDSDKKTPVDESEDSFTKRIYLDDEEMGREVEKINKKIKAEYSAYPEYYFDYFVSELSEFVFQQVKKLDIDYTRYLLNIYSTIHYIDGDSMDMLCRGMTFESESGAFNTIFEKFKEKDNHNLCGEGCRWL